MVFNPASKMPTEHHVIEFEASRFLVELDHDSALKLLSNSGAVLPAIPADANTTWELFRTGDGRLRFSQCLSRQTDAQEFLQIAWLNRRRAIERLSAIFRHA